MTDLMKKTAKALEGRGFEVHTVATAPVAKELILSMIPEGASIGAGGSVTIRELGVVDTLLSQGHKVYWHWLPDADKTTVYDQAAHADVYLASANAVTADGQLVNTDGTCNRVAAMIQGPQTVILAVGLNKLVDGAKALADGLITFDADGVSKLTSAINEDLDPLLARAQLLIEAAQSYNNYSGLAEGMDGAVRFIYRTDAIE